MKYKHPSTRTAVVQVLYTVVTAGGRHPCTYAPHLLSASRWKGILPVRKGCKGELLLLLCHDTKYRICFFINTRHSPSRTTLDKQNVALLLSAKWKKLRTKNKEKEPHARASVAIFFSCFLYFGTLLMLYLFITRIHKTLDPPVPRICDDSVHKNMYAWFTD